MLSEQMRRSRLLGPIQDEIEALAISICDGIPDFSAYQAACGELRGLRKAERIIQEEMRKLIQEDEE
jgi:hypothetical protein